MAIIPRLLVIAGFVVLAACARQADSPIAGDWTLANEASRIGFVSIKAGEIVEAHHFKKVAGSVDADGGAEVRIDLASLETNVDIRNERMRTMLFEIDTYPEATVTAQLDSDALANLAPGESLTRTVALSLSLHGAEQTIETEMTITRAGPDKVLVAAVNPIVLDADSFNLGEGIEMLRSVAGLPSITPQVPVTISLVFLR